MELDHMRPELMAVIQNGDPDDFRRVREKLGIPEGGAFCRFTQENKCAMFLVLDTARTVEWHCKKLSDGVAHDIIECTAAVVDFPWFLYYVNHCIETMGEISGSVQEDMDDRVETRNEKFNSIPEGIWTSLLSNNYTKKVARKIGGLNDEALKTLIAFIESKKLNEMCIEFKSLIIRRIYDNRLIPANLVFGYMNVCLCQ